MNQAVTAAAIQAADPFVDYLSYDSNFDGVITPDELHITVIAAGQESSYGQPFTAKRLWGHRWARRERAPVVDGVEVGGWGYTQFGEMHGDHMATIGIMVHEFGHDLELPDLYDPDYTSNGVGIWSVMSAGSWASTASRYRSRHDPAAFRCVVEVVPRVDHPEADRRDLDREHQRGRLGDEHRRRRAPAGQPRWSC